MEKNYKISVCSNYDCTKSKESNNDKVAHGWALKEFEWTEDSVRSLLTQNGISCNEYISDHKTSEAWQASHHLMLDFDDGSMTKKQLLSLQKTWRYDSYVFSSQNHNKPKIHNNEIKEPCDRLRVLIPLAEPIYTEEDRLAVEKALLDRFPGLDKSFMKRARYFAHGTTEVSSFKNSKGALDWRLIEGFDEIRKSIKIVGKIKTKDNLIHLRDMVKDKDGSPKFVMDLRPDEPIFCLFCGDSPIRTNDGHNAVIKMNSKGLPILFCSSCEARGEGIGGKGVYEFDKVDGFIYAARLEDKMVFIDTIKSKKMGGCIEPGLDEFVIRELAGQEYVVQFCKHANIPVPDTFPRGRYELVFDSDKIFDFENGYVNKYISPEILLEPIPTGHIAKLPTYIGLLIEHIMGDDRDIIDRFYNDLAYFTQERKKLITSFLMQGVEGTGKGVFFTNVLQKMFGMRYCTQTDQDAFGTKFNSFLTDNVLVLVNEVSGNFSSSDSKNLSTIEKMKIAITDEYIQIEGKSKDRINGRNTCTFLFASNRRHPITLSDSDRRFNVAPRQEMKLDATLWWPGYQQLKKLIENELQEFVWYLKQYKVNESLIGKVIDNEPKQVLQIMSQTNADQFFEAVNNGDLAWLQRNVVKVTGYDSDIINAQIDNILFNLLDTNYISSSDLRELYNNINNKNLTKNMFGRYAAGYSLKPKPIKTKTGDVIWGVKIDWTRPQSDDDN